MHGLMGIFKWIKFCLQGRSFRIFSNDYILLVLFCFVFDYFSFSTYETVFAGTVQLICWSDKLVLSSLFSSLNCISGLVLLCFSSNKNLFCFNSFCRFFDILREIFLTSLGKLHSSLILLKLLLNSRFSAKQFKMRVTIKKTQIRNRKGTNP